MSIVYKCSHCGQMIGELKQHHIDTSMLGWDKLSTQDKQEMIHYQNNGDIHIQAICEDCEKTLGEHPQYHELDFFIQ